MAGRTVLVVEDDAAIREMVTQLLTYEGYEPVEARDGVEALRRLRQERVAPALILLDLMMPGMNGRQFRAEQLTDPALAEIPVVVMSASDDGDVPADDRIGKPFDIDVLLETVSRCATPARLEAWAPASLGEASFP